MYKSNTRLKEFIMNKAKPSSIEPNSRLSHKTNPLIRALKTNQSNHSVASFWSNLIPKLCSSKLPTHENAKTGRSQTPSKPKSKSKKGFTSNQKKKAKIVFNARKVGGKMLKFKGAKRERSKNLSSKKSEKGWFGRAREDKLRGSNGAEYAYFRKRSKSKAKKEFSRSPTSIRQANFCSISKKKGKVKQEKKSSKKGAKEAKLWKLKNELPSTLKGTSGSNMKNSSKMLRENLEISSKKHAKKIKKAYSKTPKNNNFGLDALKITFEYLSSAKNVDKQAHLGTFMTNTSAVRLFSPNREPNVHTKEPKGIKKISNTFFKNNPTPLKLSKNRLTQKNLKINKLQINVENPLKNSKKKVKPASTRVATRPNFFPSKKLIQKKFCEYNGDVQAKRQKERSALKLKKAGVSTGKKIYLSKNENVWINGTRKDWKGFSTCKNYISKSKNFFGASNLFGGRFHKEEKLVAEIVGVGKKKLLVEEAEYGLKKSKTFRKGRKLSESLKKGKLNSKGKVLKLSKPNQTLQRKDQTTFAGRTQETAKSWWHSA